MHLEKDLIETSVFLSLTDILSQLKIVLRTRAEKRLLH